MGTVMAKRLRKRPLRNEPPRCPRCRILLEELNEETHSKVYCSICGYIATESWRTRPRGAP